MYRDLTDLTLKEGLEFLNAEDLTHQLAVLANLPYEEYANLPATPDLLDIPDTVLPDPIEYPQENITTQQWLDLQNSEPYEVLNLDLGMLFKDAYPIVRGFTNAMTSITSQFTNIFPTSDTQATPDGFTQSFGRLHLIIQVCKETLTPFPQVLEFPLIQTLNLISYIQYNSKRLEAQYDSTKTH